MPEERRAAVSRQTAALVYGYGVLMPPAIQVTLASPRRTNMPGVRWYVDRLEPVDVEWVDDIRVTRPSRIVLDLLADGYSDLEHLGSIVSDAIQDGRLAAGELADAVAPFAVRYGLPAGDGATLVEVMLDSSAEAGRAVA
jgi:hypothetical protein